MSIQNSEIMVGDELGLNILLLAAGASSRMGQSKQLLSIDGKPLLQKMAEEAVKASVGKVVVVLGAQANVHQAVIKNLPVEMVIHHEWQKGMGSSLKAGLQFIMNQSAKASAILVMVCDQPFLTSMHLKKLVEEFRSSKKRIVASAYQNILGVPCVFSREYFPALLALADTEGARTLIKNAKDEVASIAFEHGEIDLDTPEDYKSVCP